MCKETIAILFFCIGFGTCLSILFILSLFMSNKGRTVEDLREQVNEMTKEDIDKLSKLNQKEPV